MNLTKEKITAFANTVKKIDSMYPGDNMHYLDFNAQLQKLIQIKDAQEQLKKMRKDAGLPSDMDQSDKINTALDRLPKTYTMPIEEQSGRKLLDTALKTTDPLEKATISTTSMAEQSKVYADNMERAVDALGKIGNTNQQPSNPVTDTGTVPAGHAMGGLIYAANGWNRGTDTIHAMLSPGEAVINARAARTFSPQITAMNAGVEPSYHIQGGRVSGVGDVNVTVGSIHNHVKDESARSIANSIKRELRRSTVTMN
jgi:hypothetical protein